MKIRDNGLVKLNQGQQRVYDLIEEGHNVFCSGVGGTGKSFLINKLRKDYGFETAITSTTGISAVNIEGETFHSGLSIPIGHPTPDNLKRVSSRVTKLFSKGKIKKIIIDEGGMITPGGMYAFTQRLKKFKKYTKDGKIQVIMFCDLGQLGAIVNHEEKKLAKKDYKTDKFYRMRQFEELNFKFAELTQGMRQDNVEMKEMLLKIRSGKGHWATKNRKAIYTLNDDVLEAIDYFNKHCYKYPLPEDEVVLATTNVSVATYNEKVFNKNLNPCGTFTAQVSGNFKPKDASADEILRLKEGLKVIILKNDIQDREYVNGSTGIITGMQADGVYLRLDKNNKEIFVESAEWHKKEYVMEKLPDSNEEVLTQKVTGRFDQIPVKPCSALSIHRSQGQTLDKYMLDLGARAANWTTGLVYVGLSRCETLEGISLKRKITPEDVRADRDALDWLEGKLRESN